MRRREPGTVALSGKGHGFHAALTHGYGGACGGAGVGRTRPCPAPRHGGGRWERPVERNRSRGLNAQNTRELDGEGTQSKLFLLLSFQKQRKIMKPAWIVKQANYEISFHRLRELALDRLASLCEILQAWRDEQRQRGGRCMQQRAMSSKQTGQPSVSEGNESSNSPWLINGLQPLPSLALAITLSPGDTIRWTSANTSTPPVRRRQTCNNQTPSAAQRFSRI